MPMVTVSISPEQAARMRAAVDCGAYASGSEVVREALRLWAATERRGAANPEENTVTDTSGHVSVASLFASHQARVARG